MSFDPTEKASSKPLHQLEDEILLQVVESITDPVFVKDAQHRWVYLNQAFCDFVGFQREELLGKSDYDFFSREQADVFWAKDDQVFASGEINTNIEELTDANNRLLVISTRKSILTDGRGNRFLFGIISDITKSTRRERYQEQIAQILKHLVLGESQEGILNIVLQVAEEALPGVIATILLLDNETQRLHPPVPTSLPMEFSQAIDGTPVRAGMGSCGEAVFSGQQVIVEDIASHPNWHRVRDLALKHNLHACWSQPVFDFAGKTVGTFALYFPQQRSPEPFELEILVTFAQLTTIALEYHRIERETLNLRALLTDMINAMPSMLIAVDLHGGVLQWNAEAERVTGISAEDAQGRKLDTVLTLTLEQTQNIYRAIDERCILNWPRIAHPWEGKDHWIDLTLYPLTQTDLVGSVIRIDDVTRQVCLEQMMVQAEKVHSLGGLAAGMAHEINNPLAGILQNIQVMKNRLQKGLEINQQVAAACGGNIELIEDYMKERKINSLIDSIAESGNRASSIVSNMLNFCRKENLEINPNNLPELMDKTIALLDNDYDRSQRYDFRKIAICKEYQAGLPAVPCEGNKLQQVFFNLLKNAAQAMEMGKVDKPRIYVRIQAVENWLQIEIEDNGPGMDAKLQRQIFEPFYTTKPVGVGTGLGLSVAYFIVTEINRGKMSVDSQPGRGTKFLIEIRLDEDSKPQGE